MRAILVLLALLTTAFGAEYAPYHWSRELPRELATLKPPSHRTAVEVDAFFGPQRTRRSLDDVLTAFGEPDGFTRQSLYSATRGTAQSQPHGGTVRFVLQGGGQLLVRTGDFHEIYGAIRYDKTGKGTLLWK